MPSEAAVQVARLMEKTIEAEKTRELLKQHFIDKAVEMMRTENNQSLESFSEFTTLLESMLQSPINQHAMEFTLERESSCRLRSRVSSCLWAKTFRDMGAARAFAE